ncbi:hypothetical protein CCHR01_18094 [Colletotrichum chrysophilum]|uniref:Uncharacterized protein n=1 Tax=Colletotrichum chrysophilum TaxID=1836956 RepID=A0AAD9E6A4_9PEZI|nr:hypothetical protein CCHR01_18094 [Colletotrichum chrysophilum]
MARRPDVLFTRSQFASIDTRVNKQAYPAVIVVMYETHHTGRVAPSRTLSLRYYKLLTLRSRFLSPSHLRAHTHTPIHTLTEHTPASAGRRERVPLHKLTLLAARDMEES